MKYEPLYPERSLRREPRPQRSTSLPRVNFAKGQGPSSNSFTSYSFRTLASHLKAAVSSNSFAIKRFRTLCKIPGIGYPFTQSAFCEGPLSLPFFFSTLPLSDLFSFPLLPCALRAPDLRFFSPRDGAGGAHRCPNPSSPTLFRINTYKSVTKQTTLTLFRINTYEKQGGGGVVWFLQPEVLHILAPSLLLASAPARSFIFGGEGSGGLLWIGGGGR
jgi:hypothetical protein